MKNGDVDLPVPDLILERLHLGELSAGAAAELQARADRDPGLRRRLAELQLSDAALTASGALQTLAAGVRARAAALPPTTARSPWALGWAAAAAAVLVTAALVPVALTRRSASGPGLSAVEAGEVRVKGLQPSLTVFRKTAGGTETLGDGATAREGDLLRLAYDSAGRRYGAIVSVDGRGSVTVHLPRGAAQAARLAAGAGVLLDEAYQLDDAPLHERFFFITSDAPFALAPVEAIVRSTGGRRHDRALSLPSGFAQFALTLQKGPTR